jgi:hypothetical protein
MLEPDRPPFLEMAEGRAVMTDELRLLTAAKFAAMYRDKVNNCLDRMRDAKPKWNGRRSPASSPDWNRAATQYWRRP